MALKLCEGGSGGDTKLIFATGSSFFAENLRKKYEHSGYGIKKKKINKEHRLVHRISKLSADFLNFFYIAIVDLSKMKSLTFNTKR